MDIYPIDWHGKDIDDKYTITMFGKTLDGLLVATHIMFFPFFYTQMPPGAGPGHTKLFIAEAGKKYGALPQYCRTVNRKSAWGFSNQAQVQLVQLAFASHKQMKWAARKMRDANMKTFESSVDPVVRFYHIRDICPATWVSVASYSEVEEPTTRATLEIRTTFDKVGPSTQTAKPPLVLGSEFRHPKTQIA